MELDGPVRLFGETDRISSMSAREGGRIATGLEFNKAAHLLTTFINEIKPLLAKTFSLKEIVAAQIEFAEKKHVGKFVLMPPPISDLNQYLP